jgi:hypothetical protein
MSSILYNFRSITKKYYTQKIDSFINQIAIYANYFKPRIATKYSYLIGFNNKFIPKKLVRY